MKINEILCKKYEGRTVKDFSGKIFTVQSYFSRTGYTLITTSGLKRIEDLYTLDYIVNLDFKLVEERVSVDKDSLDNLIQLVKDKMCIIPSSGSWESELKIDKI